ncbi:hypothetical protein FRACA_370011 [Frankia canadensis]|uniref:Bacterial transcriptional activator domain-containing protein n=1 Tax=Frankia canadensis TaxID=1836972 RepID=A0A2I2KVQ2_9ACTN|nr:AfsR/SARP family transcriptional regulator [Frankia canadensis]SNQ49734.1 hypothetical protein FRACA_370011 [Frankia canadensis]SOU57024.1 hypothetical protein FRACA_370011 [Frankia canadensis]
MLEPGRRSNWEVLVTSAPGYSLRVDPRRLDVTLFEELLEQARPVLAAGAPELALTRLRRASRLWRGAAYEDVGDAEFVLVERNRLAELRLAATADRLDAEIAIGRAAELVGELRRLVAEYPLRERFWARLMVALHESGRQAEALDVYREARAHLVREVGVEPGPELRALESAILAEQPCPPRYPTRPQPLPASLGADRNPLIGRDVEMGWLREAWRRALDDDGAVVVIESEPAWARAGWLPSSPGRWPVRELPFSWPTPSWARLHRARWTPSVSRASRGNARCWS